MKNISAQTNINVNIIFLLVERLAVMRASNSDIYTYTYIYKSLLKHKVKISRYLFMKYFDTVLY